MSINLSMYSKKKIINVLKKNFGLGDYRLNHLCQKLGYQKNAIFSDLNSIDLVILKKYIEKHFKINNDLRKEKFKYILNIVNSKSYKAKRHYFGYPVRGQRTLSNGKTQKRLGKIRLSSKVFSNAISVSNKTRKFSFRKKKKSLFKKKRTRF